MTSNLNKKPRFYFNSQKAARDTIIGLFVGGVLLLILAFTSYLTFIEHGYISIPQKGGQDYLVHGASAKATIYLYICSCAILFGLAGYFSITYNRIRNAQKKHSITIVPEHCTPLEVICPECLKKYTICTTSDCSCYECGSQLEERKKYYERQNLPKRRTEIISDYYTKSVSSFEQFYKSLYPDLNELSIFLMGFILFLLIIFNPECRTEIMHFFDSKTGPYNMAPSLYIFLAIGFSVIAILATGISFAHLLVISKKDNFSVLCMKIFALLLLGYIGIKSGVYAFEKHNYVLWISPGWNILMTAICYAGLGMIDEIPFDQMDSKFRQTFLSLVLVSIIFYFLNFVLKLYWPIIFSLCINYVICINKGVNSTFLKQYNICNCSAPIFRAA